MELLSAPQTISRLTKCGIGLLASISAVRDLQVGAGRFRHPSPCLGHQRHQLRLHELQRRFAPPSQHILIRDKTVLVPLELGLELIEGELTWGTGCAETLHGGRDRNWAQGLGFCSFPSQGSDSGPGFRASDRQTPPYLAVHPGFTV